MVNSAFKLHLIEKKGTMGVRRPSGNPFSQLNKGNGTMDNLYYIFVKGKNLVIGGLGIHLQRRYIMG